MKYRIVDDVNTSMILMNGVCKIAAEQMAGAAIWDMEKARWQKIETFAIFQSIIFLKSRNLHPASMARISPLSEIKAYEFPAEEELE